ncbi:hypothetical protein [Actinoallomurus sp. CA-150999]|uniref:hypothetical protein n=1 Tax=Actinoallomurus sp. CA-150999 TaxID=3239887 RepID=UPI003D8E5679
MSPVWKLMGTVAILACVMGFVSVLLVFGYSLGSAIVAIGLVADISVQVAAQMFGLPVPAREHEHLRFGPVTAAEHDQPLAGPGDAGLPPATGPQGL